jgi:phage baseplate assembly protein W
MQRLSDAAYLSFPFRVGPEGPQTSGRLSHVREQIEQVLYTNPQERVFRPEFGAGIPMLIFEPHGSVLRETLRKRLMASLAEALRGEVDPKTLEVSFPEPVGSEKLVVEIAYTLATIGHSERHSFEVG